MIIHVGADGVAEKEEQIRAADERTQEQPRSLPTMLNREIVRLVTFEPLAQSSSPMFCSSITEEFVIQTRNGAGCASAGMHTFRSAQKNTKGEK